MPMDWIYGLIGGLMIGLAGAGYLLLNGRIMGASGVIGGLLDGTAKSDAFERLAFVAGLILLPALLGFFTDLPPTLATDNLWLLVAAGLMVGVGTRIGGGCTSGHGVCGMSRLSVRSIVATVVYIAAGIVAFAALRAIGGVA